jgi:MoaA/NifB/PqqE/SkfB family radical SAM enzyme
MLSIAVTQNCNLRCPFCYADAGRPTKELSLSELLTFYHTFMAAFEKHTNAIDVTVTGGEPLLRLHTTLTLLESITSYSGRRPDDRITLNTNGTLLDHRVGERLREMKGLHVWVSIDGDETRHDSLRGSGSYLLATRAIEILAANGVWCGVAFFPCESNLNTMVQTAQKALEIGASQFAVQFPMSVGRWRDNSIASFINPFHQELRRLHGRFGQQVQSPLASIHNYLSMAGKCPIGKNITFHVTPSGEIFPCYSLVGTQFSIGTIRTWPSTLGDFNRALAQFEDHLAFLDASQIGCLAGCPATLPEGSPIPESWILLHKRLSQLSGN